ncbi:MAG: HipA N-terminal domain-containing protein [Bacteroidales bacterium]|nr:HipA N-terminal domain-containing protein [Bacteroidales bacterium]
MEGLTVNVKIWGEVIGVLAWDNSKDIAVFQYAPKFLRSGLDVAPITMPLGRSGEETVYQFLGNRGECFKGLPGLIADSLPDRYGNEIINEWFASKGLVNEEITPLDRLCYIGTRGMGALEFEPSKKIEGLDKSTLIHIDELTELAQVGRNVGINSPERVIKEVVDVVSRWEDYAEDCGVREAHKEIIRKNLLLLMTR